MSKQIKHSQLFIHSLFYPKKLAGYRILSIGRIIQYTFLLITVLTAFSFGQFVKGGATNFLTGELAQFAEDLTFLVYILGLVFLFAMNTAVIFGKISIYAYVALLFANPMKKRAQYRQLWRTAALAITWEVILSIVFSILQIPSSISLLLFILITMTLLIIALTKYPKLPTTNK